MPSPAVDDMTQQGGETNKAVRKVSEMSLTPPIIRAANGDRGLQ